MRRQKAHPEGDIYKKIDPNQKRREQFKERMQSKRNTSDFKSILERKKERKLSEVKKGQSQKRISE